MGRRTSTFVRAKSSRSLTSSSPSTRGRRPTVTSVAKASHGKPRRTSSFRKTPRIFPHFSPLFAFPNFFIFSLFFYKIIRKSYTFFNVLIIFFPLFRPSPLPPKYLSLNRIISSSDRVAAARRSALCAFISINSSLFCSLPLSLSLEGEIISNYRESRRRRNLPCTSPGDSRGRPNKICRRESAIWRLSGLSSPIPAASEARAHAVGSFCLFTVIRYSFSGHRLIGRGLIGPHVCVRLHLADIHV